MQWILSEETLVLATRIQWSENALQISCMNNHNVRIMPATSPFALHTLPAMTKCTAVEITIEHHGITQTITVPGEKSFAAVYKDVCKDESAIFTQGTYKFKDSPVDISNTRGLSAKDELIALDASSSMMQTDAILETVNRYSYVYAPTALHLHGVMGIVGPKICGQMTQHGGYSIHRCHLHSLQWTRM